MRLTITILSGARTGERIPLGPGEMLRVGRTSSANIIVADDPTMSGIHYLVRCTSDGGSIHDLESRNGLFLNGRQVDQAPLCDGDEIRAGRTYFSISLDSASLVRASPDGASLEGAGTETRPAKGRSRSQDETRRAMGGESTRAESPRLPNRSAKTAGNPLTLYLPDATPAPLNLPGDDAETIDSSPMSTSWKPPKPAVEYDLLYAIVDGASARGLVREAKRVNLRLESLLPSGSSPYLAAVVPYLVEVELDSDFLRLWRTMLAKNPGILIESRADFDAMLVHTRTLFLAKDDQGKQSYFRFYDPNVLYEWLTKGSADRLDNFFGFANAVIVGLDKGERLLRLTYQSSALSEEEVFAS